ncbi:MAG: hypothetical protein HY581_02655 [Nitrospirae bacterium]|nr:hypothetical protein [Nitrospirota bacterium]
MSNEFVKRLGVRSCLALMFALLALVGRVSGSDSLAQESLLAPQGESVNAPEITRIAPTWGSSGWVISLTLEGRNLQSASEVRFVPATGMVVEDAPVVNSEGTVATVKVTILVHAPLGPRLVVVRTPAGQSSLTPTEANIFKVSFAHLH